MALIRCQNCKRLFSDRKNTCLNCGTPVEQTSEKLIEEKMEGNGADKQEDDNLKLIVKIILMIIVSLIVLYGINKFMSNRANDAKTEQIIALAKAQDETELLNKKKFLAEKSNVLKQIIEYSEANKYENVVALCSKYVDIHDKDLNPLCAEVKDKLERKALLAQKAIDEKESEERWKAAEKEKTKQEAELKASMGQKAWKLHKKHPKWSIEDSKNTAEGRYWIGMSLDMLKANRGQPNSANPSNFGNGTNWQWCWHDYTPSCFYGGSDGIVTSYN